jgi:predicted nuclease of predicted toxin-antitoxin system
MRVLLDECVTRYLKRDLTGHEVFTAEEAGFKGLKNGRLLQAAAAASYDVLITVDRNLRHQQNPQTLPIPVIVLSAGRSTYQMLRPLMPRVLEALEKVEAGQAVVIKS